MSLESVDDVTRSLNELRRMLAADDLSGVRRLVYFGQLDWLRERLEPREYFTLRDRVNAGDMRWLRSRFLSSDITWIKQAVQRRDSEGLRAASRLGQLAWLAPVIPAGDYRQLSHRLDANDLGWMEERLPHWALEELVDTEAPASQSATDAKADSLVLTPLAPANRIETSTASPSEFYDAFTDYDDQPRTPPVAIVSDLPDRPRRRKRRRLSPAWIAALLMLVAAGSLAYLSLRDSNERTATVPTTASTTVSRPSTIVSTSVATTVATTAAPTTAAPTTAAPTTLPPLATDIVYFSAGSTSINTQAAAVLDAAAAKIKANPGLTVRLTGVADSSGSASTNQLVSQRRAESVQSALTQRGAQAKYEITAAGTDATSPPDKARRVEIAYVRA
jgi:outer membrane protein OmpA-like peptidoglycan-associated protein